MDFDLINSYLKKKLKEVRYQHTLRVVDMGIILAEKFKYENINKVKLGCYLHDVGKNLGSNKIFEIVCNEGYKLSPDELKNINIFHGVASMVIARDEFNIRDEEVLNSIKNHVTGVENMSMLDKIVFLADFFEIGRDFNRVNESRNEALINFNINKSLFLAYNSIISELLSKNLFIHENTLKARNFVLRELNDFCF